MIAALADWTLRGPMWLSLIAAIPWIAIRRARRGGSAIPVASLTFVPEPKRSTLRLRLRSLPDVLALLGGALMVLALSRPVERVPLPLVVEGVDVMLCLDVSSSMAAQDMDPARSRLSVAKTAAARFLAARPHDRIGLITFARFPDLRCPTTLDHRALAEILDGVEQIEHGGDEDVTGIGTAVARAVATLRGSKARSKIVVLVTDGEENVATTQTPDEIDPGEAARLARGFGVRVYTIAAGIGSQQQDGRFLPIDTRQVEKLATDTRGAFFAARDAAAIDQVYAHVDALEKESFEEPRFVFEERFVPILLLGVALWLGGLLLRATWLEVLP
ncbi:MAG: VWA domain-containing protein [Planctomycetota bacterium]